MRVGGWVGGWAQLQAQAMDMRARIQRDAEETEALREDRARLRLKAFWLSALVRIRRTLRAGPGPAGRSRDAATQVSSP